MPMFLTNQLDFSSASSCLCFHSLNSTCSLLRQPHINSNSCSILCWNSFSIKYHSSSSCIARVSAHQAAAAAARPVTHSPPDDALQAPSPRGVADWKEARTYNGKGLIHRGRVENFNGGGLLVRFQSLLGFLPFPLLKPNKSIQEIAKALKGSLISVKVIQADETSKKLILSERIILWCCYHLTGLVHVSEVSWDLVQDVRDVLQEGDEVRVKIIKIDRAKSRITLSIKQLEEDPLLERQTGFESSGEDESYDIEPLQGLKTIIEELLQEDGITDVQITRQGFEKWVVSQDLQLWLSNAPSIDGQCTLLARAGRQVQ
ncbi:hypothetical protein DCAR_0727814 [Daucus carota subsp. sativus]|uniref:S1 motif domain-containing protein n=1 Tax=Daucus carota subsp. sativus TaxID=79200 RepID=A0AAF1B6V3_DAUCS|nr:hypothetical protein DCAR_0727814 [Daucus carota subsp. sativus]